METKTKERIKTIAITGPECTGKTSLCVELANYLERGFSLEYAREYLNKIKRPYTVDDLLIIAERQFKNQKKTVENSEKSVIFDTDLLTIKIWSNVKYGQCDPQIEDLFLKSTADFYLLCYPDLPWVYDSQRESPLQREYLFNLHIEELEKHKLEYAIVKGIGDIRFQNALEALSKNDSLMS